MVRFKNRYLLCLIDAEYASDQHVFELHNRELLSAIRSSLATNFGDLAVAQSLTSLAIKLWSPALAMCLVRCSRDHFRTVWAAASLITCIHGMPHLGNVRFSVIHVGGTIRSCQKAAAARARHMIVEQRERGGDVEKLDAAAAVVRAELDAMDV